MAADLLGERLADQALRGQQRVASAFEPTRQLVPVPVGRTLRERLGAGRAAAREAG
jgi:hypothetical protein